MCVCVDLFIFCFWFFVVSSFCFFFLSLSFQFLVFSSGCFGAKNKKHTQKKNLRVGRWVGRVGCCVAWLRVVCWVGWWLCRVVWLGVGWLCGLGSSLKKKNEPKKFEM